MGIIIFGANYLTSIHLSIYQSITVDNSCVLGYRNETLKYITSRAVLTSVVAILAI